MANITDSVEAFILAMLEAHGDSAEFKRNELAGYFGCVPSQITYVISTRFTLDKGYVIQSKKGGGGYIRISKMNSDKTEYLNHLKNERIGSSICYKEARDIVCRLYDSGLLTAPEQDIVLSALKEIPLPMNSPYKDMIRAGIFKNMIVVILNREE